MLRSPAGFCRFIVDPAIWKRVSGIRIVKDIDLCPAEVPFRERVPRVTRQIFPKAHAADHPAPFIYLTILSPGLVAPEFHDTFP